MNRPQNVIKNNLYLCKSFDEKTALLKEAQFEEAICFLKNSDDISNEEIKDFFVESFSLSPISGKLLKLFSRLYKNNVDLCKEHAATAVKIAIIKSPLSQKALESLTFGYSNVTCWDFQDFRSACEAVSDDICEYCILPVCSSHDGYYPTFSKLLKAYELKICRIARISKNDSDEEIQFALLSKFLEANESSKHIMFSFIEDDSINPADVIGALNENDCMITSILSTPLEFDMDRSEYRIETQLKSVSTTAFISFLNAVLPGHTVLGIY